MKTIQQPTELQIRTALLDVMDPEIPNLSIVDLGVVRNIAVRDDSIEVELMPTFVGCPALEVMKEGVRERLQPLAPDHTVVVKVIILDQLDDCSVLLKHLYLRWWDTEVLSLQKEVSWHLFNYLINVFIILLV